MVLLLGLALVAAEIWVLVVVAGHIGVLDAIVLLILVSALGPFLVKRAGFAVWRRAGERVAHGEVPGREVIDGVLLLTAGLLICIPGFITDAAGLLLLLPPVRAAVRRMTGRRFANRVTLLSTGLPGGRRFPGAGGRGVRRRGQGPVVDAGSHGAGPGPGDRDGPGRAGGWPDGGVPHLERPDPDDGPGRSGTPGSTP